MRTNDDYEKELAALRRQLAAQTEELERVRHGSNGGPSRRALLTGGAAAAGGALAFKALNSSAAHAAVDGHDILYPATGETAHLFLQANGDPIHGDSPQTSLGRQDSIVCFYFQQKVSTAAGKGGSTTLQYDDVVIRKRVDKSSPRIAQAHDTGAKLSGQFKFYRPNPTGDGTTEQFFTIAFTGGQVIRRDIFLPDLAAAAGSGGGAPGVPYEEIGMRLSGLSWTIEDGNISWGGAG